MRQYEPEDCDEDALEGKAYEVVKFTSQRGCGHNCVELVVGFGNRETMHSVWVPYGSTIDIGGTSYKIIKGAPFGGRRDESNQSTFCLKDSQNTLLSLDDFMGKNVTVQELGSLENKAK